MQIVLADIYCSKVACSVSFKVLKKKIVRHDRVIISILQMKKLRLRRFKYIGKIETQLHLSTKMHLNAELSQAPS